MVLAVDVLLDGPTGSADADRVQRHAVVLDEVLLEHQRRLAAEHEVVVRVGARSGRVEDRVPERQPLVVERAAGQATLVVADRHAAVEAVDDPPFQAVSSSSIAIE